MRPAWKQSPLFGSQSLLLTSIAQHWTSNEHTDEHINFFGLEIELWQIGDSPIAPKFNITSKPNDWSRAVKAAATQGDITEHNQLQLRFWTAFKDYMEKNSQIRSPKPSPAHWMSHSIGRGDVHLNSIISTWNSVTGTYGPEIRVELGLTGEDAQEHFDVLVQKRSEIERAIGSELTWHNPVGKKQRKVYMRADADF